MSRTRHFYVTLPSKSSNVDFPTNQTTNFRVRLKNTVKLQGQWEVALASVTYPRTWFDVVENRNGFILKYKGEDHPLRIEAGHYKAASEVVAAMNNEIEKVIPRPSGRK